MAPDQVANAMVQENIFDLFHNIGRLSVPIRRFL